MCLPTMMSARSAQNVSHGSWYQYRLPRRPYPGSDLRKFDLQIIHELTGILLIADKHVVVRGDGPLDADVACQVHRLLVGHVTNAASLQTLGAPPVDRQERHGRPVPAQSRDHTLVDDRVTRVVD